MLLIFNRIYENFNSQYSVNKAHLGLSEIIVVYSEKKTCQFYEEYMGSLTNLPPRTFVYSNPDI